MLAKAKSKFLLILLIFFFYSCNQPTKPISSLELLDIRVDETGKIRLNGQYLTETSLKSHLNAYAINESTNVRAILSDSVYTGIVMRLTREFAERGLRNVQFHMLDPAEFKKLGKTKVFIDILSDGTIMYEGNLVHPKDLKIIFQDSELIKLPTTVLITISGSAELGTVLDVQKMLAQVTEIHVLESNSDKIF